MQNRWLRFDPHLANTIVIIIVMIRPAGVAPDLLFMPFVVTRLKLALWACRTQFYVYSNQTRAFIIHFDLVEKP